MLPRTPTPGFGTLTQFSTSIADPQYLGEAHGIVEYIRKADCGIDSEYLRARTDEWKRFESRLWRRINQAEIRDGRWSVIGDRELDWIRVDTPRGFQ
jgi:hypothetical protein